MTCGVEGFQPRRICLHVPRLTPGYKFPKHLPTLVAVGPFSPRAPAQHIESKLMATEFQEALEEPVVRDVVLFGDTDGLSPGGLWLPQERNLLHSPVSGILLNLVCMTTHYPHITSAPHLSGRESPKAVVVNLESAVPVIERTPRT